MNVDRLHALAKFLRQVPAKKPGSFSLDSWGSMYGQEGGDPAPLSDGTLMTKDVILATCGMTACAIGWAGSVPLLREAGLELVLQDGEAFPRYNGRQHWDAVMDFFGIDRYLAHHLFLPDNYHKKEDEETGKYICTATAADVADRIDDATGFSSKAPGMMLLV